VGSSPIVSAGMRFLPNSLLLCTVANLILAFQTTATGLIFWRFVSGLGIGLEMVTIGTYISELVPKQIRGHAFACEQAVGFMAVPIVAFLSYLLVLGKPLGFDGWRCVVMIGAHGSIFVWFIWSMNAFADVERFGGLIPQLSSHTPWVHATSRRLKFRNKLTQS
jgi:MFS family permease